jgi:hypothetical protein
MNHGVALDPKERSYFPVIEFRDAALWFAKQGYVVVAPIRPGYGAAAIEIPERGLFGLFFSGVGDCSDANFRDAGLAIASLDMWVIEYMSTQSFIKRNDVIVASAFQAAGGNVEYHLLPDFGADGHFFIDSPDAVRIWAPLVSEFLRRHQ